MSEQSMEGYSAGKELFLPVMGSSGATWGCQVDWDVSGYEKWLAKGAFYQTPARWFGLDPWLDHNIETFQRLGSPFILGTKTCPAEYRLWPDYLGSQPKPEHYPRFGEWAAGLAVKYRPWGIELWTEPDCPRRYVEDPNYFGAWVSDADDFYLAGRAYGEFCRTVYPAIKAAGCSVIAGSLLGAPSSLDFVQGMIDAKFEADFVSFHKYLRMGEDFHLGFELAFTLGAMTNKPVIFNETNVLGDGGEEHRKRQAEYCAFLKENYGYADVRVMLWYSLINVWWHTEMIWHDEPTPAYEVWRK